jgi:YesN/AraC family two-component response regulator
MTLFINYDINAICKKILQEQLDKLGLKYSILGLGEVEIRESVSDEKLKQLNALLNSCNIEIVEIKKSIMIQKIKEAIIEMVFMEDELPLKTSSYLADKLNHNYTYLSNIFSSVTYTSIETFIIMQKTERAKQLLSTNELNINEIGYKLNYSSAAHFSNQFKKSTGLSPTAFQRIITKRRDIK